MSRRTKTRNEADADSDEAASDEATSDEPSHVSVDDSDPHGFWDRANLDGDANDDAFADVIDVAGEMPDERETLVYMGSVTEVDRGELAALAEWVEAKACRSCRRKMQTQPDVVLLKHAECRTAFRVSGLLHRYH